MASTVYKSIVSELVARLRSVLKPYGIKLTVTSAARSSKQQAALYASRGSSKYPVAPPGTSQHEYGAAVDMVAKPREYQSIIGQIWQGAGLYWSPNDEVHFALFDPATWSKMLGGALPAEMPPAYLQSMFQSTASTGQAPYSSPLVGYQPVVPALPISQGSQSPSQEGGSRTSPSTSEPVQPYAPPMPFSPTPLPSAPFPQPSIPDNTPVFDQDLFSDITPLHR